MKRPKEGKIRLCDDSMQAAGLRKGDVCIVSLTEKPKRDKPGAAVTSEGKLLVRYYHRHRDGSIRLTRQARAKTGKVYGPDEVVVFGPIVRVEKGGGA